MRPVIPTLLGTLIYKRQRPSGLRMKLLRRLLLKTLLMLPTLLMLAVLPTLLLMPRFRYGRPLSIILPTLVLLTTLPRLPLMPIVRLMMVIMRLSPSQKRQIGSNC